MLLHQKKSLVLISVNCLSPLHESCTFVNRSSGFFISTFCIFRPNGCFQCLLIMQRHPNIIQYKESKFWFYVYSIAQHLTKLLDIKWNRPVYFLDIIAASATLLFNLFSGFCLNLENLQDVCDRIQVESILYTLVRGRFKSLFWNSFPWIEYTSKWPKKIWFQSIHFRLMWHLSAYIRPSLQLCATYMTM